MSSLVFLPAACASGHLHRYNFRRAGQQGPTRKLTAALKRAIKLGTLGTQFQFQFQFQFIPLIELEYRGKNSCTDRCPEKQ